MITINDKLTEEITKLVIEELVRNGIYPKTGVKKSVPIGISARHVHLHREHLDILFGQGYELKIFKEISQPGQFAANEKVTLMTPKGRIDNVRILGPLRKETQIEISLADARKLGIMPPVRESGNLDGSQGMTIIGPAGTIELTRGCIISERHIHMTPTDALAFGVENGQKVKVKIEGYKSGIMDNVFVRVREDFKLDMHIDTDDGNAFMLKNGDLVEIIR